MEHTQLRKGGELHLLVFPCCFPHACQPLGHAFPALCRVRVRLTGVLLDRSPSLPTLRRRPSVFVRMVHRYYAAVRLLADVQAGRVALAFARCPAAWFGHRCLRGLPVLVHEVSRRGWGLRLHRAEQELALTLALMCLPRITKTSASGLHFFEARSPTPPISSPETPLHATPVSTTWKPRVAAFFLSK